MWCYKGGIRKQEQYSLSTILFHMSSMLRPEFPHYSSNVSSLFDSFLYDDVRVTSEQYNKSRSGGEQKKCKFCLNHICISILERNIEHQETKPLATLRRLHPNSIQNPSRKKSNYSTTIILQTRKKHIWCTYTNLPLFSFFLKKEHIHIRIKKLCKKTQTPLQKLSIIHQHTLTPN